MLASGANVARIIIEALELNGMVNRGVTDSNGYGPTYIVENALRSMVKNVKGKRLVLSERNVNEKVKLPPAG